MNRLCKPTSMESSQSAATPSKPRLYSVQTSISATPLRRLGAALFYGACSLGIMFVNKIVLSVYDFPSFSFLAMSQFVFTTFVLWVLNCFGQVTISPVSPKVARVMAPLTIISTINVLSGLGGTKVLSLPMFSALRRLSILMTMVAEAYVFGTKPNTEVKLSVFLMVVGSFIAAISDLGFNAAGYTMIFISDVFTALNGVVLRKTLTNTQLSKMSVLFHNSWTGIVSMLCLLAARRVEVEAILSFEHWQRLDFLAAFILASCMGSILNYSIFLCTHLNSALTTTVVGCLKNLASTYMAMIFMDDYAFSINNFVGINVSIFGSLVYSWCEFKEISRKRPPPNSGHDRIDRRSPLSVRQEDRDVELTRLLRDESAEEKHPVEGIRRPD